MFRYMDDVELSMCRLCNRACRRKALQRIFVLTSRLGNGLFWYVLIAVLPLLYGYQGWHTSLRMAVAGAIGVLVYKLLKSRLVRQRPYIRHGAIHRGTVPLDVYSFPSGHTLHAVAFTWVACWWHPELGWVLVPFGVAVAMSRVVLGLHYPSDVLAGAGLGVLIAVTVCSL